MSYIATSGQYVDALTLNMNAIQGTTITADGYSDVFEMAHRRGITGKLTVTSVSASDTLDVTLQTSDDGTNWWTLGTFTQATGATTERKSFPACGRKLRAFFDVGGASVSIVAALEIEAV